MKRIALIALLALTACRTETVEVPAPVEMTETTIGHFCQMNLLEHPGPKAQVHLKDVMFPLFFSQVRDGIAYQRMPEQSHEIVTMYVSDMGVAPDWADPGAANWIPADDAFYVVGSRLVGGMGAAEMVPFGNEQAAQAFAALNGGDILRLNQIATEDVLAPDEGAAPEAAEGDEPDYAERLRRLGTQGGQ
ncbi:MAG: nitrous oxide reductase accessory protein NosL [Paracoccus sp. (in: a-proteobacteria)]|uniref:nitrous oxide reductase accessory protein NosL n=1 Tax=Paracoccus sp. TaxID=267 RepID=UPI0026DF1FFA|nr:nitrous oxide reductase accessory protein NosL [Paracoccus sp. (in: a-proteobacteria)]MDO5630309.1 nitrous oxide reductase accessory protein NosL [Paracoccus sp. (in: a-proteobacteria)]